MQPLRTLYRKLTEDEWRKTHPFSDNISKVHDIVFHPYRTDGQREEAYLLWMQRNQPCLFGRIAAASRRIHFCILDEEDILSSDAHIADKIEQERLEWKRRSLHPHESFSHPAHGFVVLATSPRLAMAAPDQNLRTFSEKLLSLWKVSEKKEAQGKVHSEWLYLRNPKKKEYLRFQFSVDFFMAQGDGRWWQDHRVPGGIAFTANSVGHMKRYREWYENMKKQTEWIAQTAMLTIAAAQETASGKATWLRPLVDGKPVVRDLKCPFAKPESLRKELQGMDWTRYAGHLHTDHSIRDEFFWADADKHPDVTRSEYIQDFGYLIDTRERDHHLFVHGQNVADREVFGDIGNPVDYVGITTRYNKRVVPTDKEEAPSSAEALGASEVEKKLKEIRSWKLKPAELM